MNDAALRAEIYRSFASSGRAPELGEEHRPALRRLHDAHALVLDDNGSVRMALPFSAIPTDHVVRGATRDWWANCAWDALAIPLLLDVDAVIEARWMDTGEPVDLTVAGGILSSTAGFVHFAVPAARWWDDIVET